ncbi:helix-turn-helix domain-containing protein [Brevibacillus choshinensis]|uniref:Helix-turn-helix domain-containing protein n=1 Tax=Brevibacillus choshinensis TaxID=54911 RepID=A0ABX7FGH2_BRECH|nr:helix-turn-helix domain-containing protein [Brevibacillus choshinensis]QRG65283.1 helix-turn-helix domain-containing protein [Brevibacillus choshinensis]
MQPTTLTVTQLAERLGVHQDTIYTMVRQKQIPHFRIRSRIFFRSETIDAWMKNQEESNARTAG